MTKKIQKISLFGNSNKKSKNKRKPKNQSKKSRAKSRTPADKVYRKLQRKGLAQKLHIFQGGTPCYSIALWYVDQGILLDTVLDKLCARANKTQPHHYYHYTKGHFYEYDAKLLKQVLSESMKQRDKQ